MGQVFLPDTGGLKAGRADALEVGGREAVLVGLTGLTLAREVDRRAFGKLSTDEQTKGEKESQRGCDGESPQECEEQTSDSSRLATRRLRHPRG